MGQNEYLWCKGIVLVFSSEGSANGSISDSVFAHPPASEDMYHLSKTDKASNIQLKRMELKKKRIL